VNRQDIIDIIDDIGFMQEIKTPQDWWELAVTTFPNETTLAMQHVRRCERK
jgi:hypothetical protein